MYTTTRCIVLNMLHMQVNNLHSYTVFTRAVLCRHFCAAITTNKEIASLAGSIKRYTQLSARKERILNYFLHLLLLYVKPVLMI